MSARAETWLWIWQRATAAILAFFVIVHLVTMIVAVRGGLSAGAILGRTHGSMAWMAFYGGFVLVVAIHAPIGLRNIAAEWLQWRGRVADIACVVVGALLLALGWRAVAAVTL